MIDSFLKFSRLGGLSCVRALAVSVASAKIVPRILTNFMASATSKFGSQSDGVRFDTPCADGVQFGNYGCPAKQLLHSRLLGDMSRRLWGPRVRRNELYETIPSGQLDSVVSPELQPPNRELLEGAEPHLRRFGIFDLNLRTRELRKAGLRLRLQEQPFRVLAVLLERPGELISRDELKRRLWGEAEFGDFDQAINVAVKKLRRTLGDDADSPRFIETLPRRGYRFIAPVTTPGNGTANVNAATDEPKGIATAAHATRFPRQYGFVVLAGALALIAIVASVISRPRQHSFGVTSVGEFRLVPLTGALGFELQPQFSPDGKEIAYAWVSGKQETPDIYVKMLKDGSPVRLIRAQDRVGHLLPAWSPDGHYIACVRFERPPEFQPAGNESLAEQIKKRMAARLAASVYIAPAIGGEEKKLFDVGEISDLRWSPDGKWFLTSERSTAGEPFSLYRVSADGGGRHRLTFPPANFNGDTFPAFAPDGKLIAFSRNFSSGGSDVFVMSAGGGEPRRITQDGEHIGGIAFSQDGHEVIFSSARGGGERRVLWRIPISGGTPRQLPFGGDDAESPTVPAMGNYLAYVKSTDSDNIWAYDIPAPGEPAKTPGRIAIGSRQLQAAPQFSPDGSRVAFASSRSGSWEIWVSLPDGTNAIQLTKFGNRQTGSPHWSPDGKQLVFDARPEKHSDIYVIDAAGGEPRRITNSGSNDAVVPNWSRDGRWIYYASNAEGNWDLWKTAVDGSQSPVQVTTHGGFAPFESADGKTLYYAKWNDSGVFSMLVNGGPETLVTGELLRSLWRYWSLSEKGIYLLRPGRKPNSPEIVPMLSFFNFETRKIVDLRSLEDGPKPGPGMTVSPDGKLLLISQPGEGGSEIMLVENFR
jgi:Tol biopolymer transport system component/DNA-binding winged helix-turn-helix (wHTH) protein